MVIRGAPAICAAAAYGLVLVPSYGEGKPTIEIMAELDKAAEVLSHSRPTAVNLFWTIKRMMKLLEETGLDDDATTIKQALLNEANAIAQEDVEANKAIGRNALPLVPDGARIIHHCNTGSLATFDYGTALGIIRMAHEEGKSIFVYVNETRPRLQGGRLTAWKLLQYGVPFKVIVDSASGHFMQTQKVDLCVVGADRVAANGDTVNKIGTYNLAVVAYENNLPFYVALPTTTIDFETPSGNLIEIEERPAKEITHVGTSEITPINTPVGNPAFDVTPAKYITGWITEKGVIYPPFKENLAAIGLY